MHFIETDDIKWYNLNFWDEEYVIVAWYLKLIFLSLNWVYFVVICNERQFNGLHYKALRINSKSFLINFQLLKTRNVDLYDKFVVWKQCVDRKPSLLAFKLKH